MRLSLCYSALSPFCRKVRMAMDHKQLTFAIVEADNVHEMPVWNPRAEVPVLVHGETVVCNSPDILGYLDRAYRELPVYPVDARRYADVRAWERTSDTQLDAIVTVIGMWRFADLPPMPAGLMDAARRDLGVIYDRLEERLGAQEFICGEISAADFAAYPHVVSGSVLGLEFDREWHPGLKRWLKAMRHRPEGQIDAAAVKEWWASRASRAADTQRVNWGTYRLEWLLANGQAEWFAQQVRQDKVLWSTGPRNNALQSAAAPLWAR